MIADASDPVPGSDAMLQDPDSPSRQIGLMRAHQGRIVWANATFAHMFGYDGDAVIGVETDTLFPDEASRERIRREARVVTATGAVWKGEVRLRRRDGSVGTFTVAWAHLGADPTDFGGSFVDVSTRVRSIRELVLSEERLRGVFDAMSEGIVLQELDGRIVDANSAAARILGVTRDQLLGRSPFDASWRALREDGTPFPPEEYPSIVTLRTGAAVRHRVMVVEADAGERHWIDVNTQPIWTGTPQVLVGVVTTFADLTEERRALQALSRARDDLQTTLSQMRAITNGVPMSIVLYDTDHRILFANEAYRSLGRSGLEAEGARAEDFLRPGVLRDSLAARQRALAGESVRMLVDVPLGEEVRRREVTFTPYTDPTGVVAGVLALGYDVTDLEQSRSRLREVVERLAAVRESERREIAMTLHEGAAQDLYAARLGLERLRGDSTDPDAVSALHDIHAMVEQAVKGIGALIHDLYPTALQHLGVADVLRQHAAKFQERSGIRVAVHAAPALPALDPERKLLFFRAAQEALTNVWRHARAGRATIEVATRSGALWLVVEDDGVGLAPGSEGKVGSLGLLAMRERFVAIGGGVDLGAASLGGARIAAWAPVERPG